MQDSTGPIHISYALARVLKSAGFSPAAFAKLEKEAPAVARLIKGRAEEVMQQPVDLPLEPVEDAADHAAPREAPTLRLVR